MNALLKGLNENMTRETVHVQLCISKCTSPFISVNLISESY